MARSKLAVLPLLLFALAACSSPPPVKPVAKPVEYIMPPPHPHATVKRKVRRNVAHSQPAQTKPSEAKSTETTETAEAAAPTNEIQNAGE